MALTRVRASQVRGLTGQYPAILSGIEPVSVLPNTTRDIVFYGVFFTPDMTVQVPGQTVNDITFVNTQEIKVNMTAGASEGEYDVILNNGIQSTYSGALIISLGQVSILGSDDWNILQQPVNIEPGKLSITTYQSDYIAEYPLDFSKDFQFHFSTAESPLSPPDRSRISRGGFIQFYSGNTQYMYMAFNIKAKDGSGSSGSISIFENGTGKGSFTSYQDFDAWSLKTFKLVWKDSLLFLYEGSSLIFTFSDISPIIGDKMRLTTGVFNFDNLKMVIPPSN
jgi:hypothetical protein